MNKNNYLPGLNSLRFFAAFFVITDHYLIAINQLGYFKGNIPEFLKKGGDAVEFFFTLSGFLITYLLIKESQKTNTISIKNFYLRRVFRIWPLYFLIILVGFISNGIIPMFFFHKTFNTAILKDLLLFIFFLPNYAINFSATAFMHPLWSIGVEEQFYLFWAPFVKKFKNNILGVIILFISITVLYYFIIVYYPGIKKSSNTFSFLLTMKYYLMAIGSLFGYILFYHKDQFNKTFLASIYFQICLWGFVVYYYFIGFSFSNTIEFKILIAFLYGLIILNISSNPKTIFKLENKVLNYLGTISYGLYMYHMLVNYSLKLFFVKFVSNHLSDFSLATIYFILLFSGTVLVSIISFKYFETKMLRLKEKYS